MEKKFLSLTIICKISSANYGESIANIISLKRFSHRGRSYTYISRQAIRYDIVRIMNQYFNIPLTPAGSDGKVVQFAANATIRDYPEIDFFGYMKTKKKGDNEDSKFRNAVVRLSDAISLEPWPNDIDFGNNMGLASRIKKDNMIFQSEIHHSYYTYTMTVDLHRIGEDEVDKIHLDNQTKYQRLDILLDTIKMLYRDIKGRREDLSPLFVIGGVYNSGNPFFYNKIELIFGNQQMRINSAFLNEILNKSFLKQQVKEHTLIGCINGFIANLNDLYIDKEKILSIEAFFNKIKDELRKYYNV